MPDTLGWPILEKTSTLNSNNRLFIWVDILDAPVDKVAEL